MALNDDSKVFEAKWKEIFNEGIEKILTYAENRKEMNFSLKDYMKIYSEAYDLCTARKSSITQPKCYSKIIQIITDYCNKIKSNYITKQNINFENELKNIFKETLYQDLNEILKAKIEESISKQRSSDIMTDIINLKNFIDFTNNIVTNENETLFNIEIKPFIIGLVEKHFLEFCKNIPKNILSNYIPKSLEEIKKEIERLNCFLPEQIVEECNCKLQDIFFLEPYNLILDSENGFKQILSNGDKQLLKNCYDIYGGHKKAMAIMISIFKRFIYDQFNLILSKHASIIKTDDPREIVLKSNYIEEYINFFKTYNSIIANCFQNNFQFVFSFKEMLEISQTENNKFNISYILPFYLDKYTRKSVHYSSQEVIQYIDDVLEIFMSVPEKDVFIEIHKSLFGRKILFEDYNSLENEYYFISKVKQLCGVSYTSYLENMIHDYNISKELNFNYKNWYRENISTLKEIKNVEFNITLITLSSWPPLNTNKLVCDQKLIDLFNNFLQFYKISFPKRSLTLTYQNSMLELEFRPTNQVKYLLIINTIQATILLLFNLTKLQITKSEVLSKLNISSDEFTNSVVPFINSKLLVGANESEEMNTDDVFYLNLKFFSQQKRIKLLPHSSHEEIIKKEKIEDDRSHAVEACVVRIMKSAKQLGHNELITKVLSQLENFRVQISLIKKKIDNLIEREILVRSKEEYDVISILK